MTCNTEALQQRELQITSLQQTAEVMQVTCKSLSGERDTLRRELDKSNKELCNQHQTLTRTAEVLQHKDRSIAQLQQELEKYEHSFNIIAQQRDLREANEELCDQRETMMHIAEFLQDKDLKISHLQKELKNSEHKFHIVAQQNRSMGEEMEALRKVKNFEETNKKLCDRQERLALRSYRRKS